MTPKMLNSLFWVFLCIFAATAVVTLCGVTKIVAIDDKFLWPLFISTLIEGVLPCVLLLFRRAFGLFRLKLALDFGDQPPAPLPPTCQCTIRSSGSTAAPKTVQLSIVREPGALVVLLPDLQPDDSVQIECQVAGVTWSSDSVNPFFAHVAMHQ